MVAVCYPQGPLTQRATIPNPNFYPNTIPNHNSNLILGDMDLGGGWMDGVGFGHISLKGLYSSPARLTDDCVCYMCICRKGSCATLPRRTGRVSVNWIITLITHLPVRSVSASCSLILQAVGSSTLMTRQMLSSTAPSVLHSVIITFTSHYIIIVQCCDADGSVTVAFSNYCHVHVRSHKSHMYSSLLSCSAQI